jgi:hypothetical protein
MFGKDSFDAFGREHVTERQTGLSQKRGHNFLKTVAARMGGIR